MDQQLFGSVRENTLVKFVLFIVLVWLSVSLGIVLAGLLTGLPSPARTIMAPTLSDQNATGKQPDVHLG